MSETHNGNGTTVRWKNLGAAALFALTVGTAIAGITRYVGAAPTREEFEREREQSRTAITAVEKDQIRLRGSLDALERSMSRIEGKLDSILESLGGRQP